MNWLTRGGVLAAQVRRMSAWLEMRDWGWRRLSRVPDDQSGQTPTEYLMIVGLMAAIIVVAFVTLFFPQFRAAAAQWVTKVYDAITGANIH